jgi:hypothetical protein
MALVSAVRVRFTLTVPEMDGAPVARVPGVVI